jgi:hypothetical protein
MTETTYQATAPVAGRADRRAALEQALRAWLDYEGRAGMRTIAAMMAEWGESRPGGLPATLDAALTRITLDA